MELASALAELDPDNGARYRSNGARVARRIEALDTELDAQLEPVRSIPYIVFHDAYQYLEKHYELTIAGSAILSPAQMPSARRLVKLRDRIKSLGARCLFREPQFESALIDIVIEGTEVRLATLDPLGVQLDPGPDAYFQMMESNVDSIVNCLSR
jgi:zinc transport system substrate-binding protein